MSTEMQQCIDSCQTCQSLCLTTVSHCLSLGGVHAEAEHIRLLLACATVCETSATLMSFGSPHHHTVCGICSELCTQCATDCERIAGGDESMLACVDACRECAESCRAMAASVEDIPERASLR